MEETKTDIVAAIIIASIIFVILGVFTLLFFLLSIRKKALLQRQKEIMVANFQQALLSAQLEMQEATLNNISQEIHDKVGQTLSLARVQVSLLEHKQGDVSLLNELKLNLGTAMSDLRSIAKGLSGDHISSLSLVECITLETERISRGSEMTVSFKTDGNIIDLSGQRNVILCRVMQECLQNIIKHAEASCIEIQLKYFNDHLHLEISDDGKGFELTASKGLGLQNMRNRVRLLGGTLTLKSTPNNGTHILIEVPYE